VQLLNRLLGDATIVIVHERESARPSRLAVGGNDDLNRFTYRAEVLPDIGVGRTIREIADE
jgi:hypothetical protein